MNSTLTDVALRDKKEQYSRLAHKTLLRFTRRLLINPVFVVMAMSFCSLLLTLSGMPECGHPWTRGSSVLGRDTPKWLMRADFDCSRANGERNEDYVTTYTYV